MAVIEDMSLMDLVNLMNDRDHLIKAFSSVPPKADRTSDEGSRSFFSPPADILSTPKDYIFYVDVPGLSKSDIQVQLEDENTLVIKSSGKRKREDGEEEGCKYLKLERVTSHKISRKFRLPKDADVSAISAKCEDGVLTVTVKKVPPVKPKAVQVAIS